jgi:hypothetical protein
MRDHGGRWQIEHTEDLSVWTVVCRSPDGRHIRVPVAHDITVLAARDPGTLAVLVIPSGSPPVSLARLRCR